MTAASDLFKSTSKVATYDKLYENDNISSELDLAIGQNSDYDLNDDKQPRIDFRSQTESHVDSD